MWKMKDKYRLIVFDWDGTLMDSEARIVTCMRLALSDMNVPLQPDHELKQVIGLGLQEALLGLVPDGTADFYQRLTEAYRKHWLDPEVEGSQLFSGIENLLYRLHAAGYLLSVITGKSRRGLAAQFEETGLGKLFASSRCADESRSKPAPDMLCEILAELDMQPSQALVIGDTTYDLGMAQAAGCDRIGVTYGVHEAVQLAGFDPMHLIESPEELVTWFEQNFLSGQQQVA